MNLAGAPNFRDLGDQIDAVRRGVVFRSEAPSALTSADVQTVRDAHIREVLDLRKPIEREENPSRWPDDIGINVRVFDGGAARDAVDPAKLMRELIDGGPDHARNEMFLAYKKFHHTLTEPLRRLAHVIIAGETPVVFHCAAGKDRTGFISAMVLSAVGIPYDDIERSYIESNDYFTVERIQGLAAAFDPRPMSDEAASEVLCKPEYLRCAIEGVEENHGSIAAYLENHIGLTEADFSALGEQLLA